MLGSCDRDASTVIKNTKINFSERLWEYVPTGIEPENVFNYVYTILYSNVYREKYNEFLKINFPRIPITNDADLFSKIAELGSELVNLHLLKLVKNLKYSITLRPYAG